MTIQPGSLDNLYYNGILDYIPYEAYSMPTMSTEAIYKPTYDPKYLDNAKQGYAYQYDGVDTFVPSTPAPINNYDKKPLQDFKDCITGKNKVMDIPIAIKGLMACGIIATTFALFVRKIKH